VRPLDGVSTDPRDALQHRQRRPLDGVIAREKHLNDLVVVVVRGEDQWRDVRRELTLLVGAKERVLLRATTQLGAGDVVRMLDDNLQANTRNQYTASRLFRIAAIMLD